MDFQRNFSLHFTGCHGLSGRTKNEMPGEMAVPDDWNSIAFIILHLWRCSFQSDLVRAYDDAFLLFDPGTYLCKRSERRKAQEAVFSYSGIVLCSFRILSLDFRLLF